MIRTLKDMKDRCKLCNIHSLDYIENGYSKNRNKKINYITDHNDTQ